MKTEEGREWCQSLGTLCWLAISKKRKISPTLYCSVYWPNRLKLCQMLWRRWKKFIFSRDGVHLGLKKGTCRQDSLAIWIDWCQSRPPSFRQYLYCITEDYQKITGRLPKDYRKTTKRLPETTKRWYVKWTIQLLRVIQNFRGKNYRRKNRKDKSKYIWKAKGVFKRERRHSKGRQMKKEGNRKGKIIRAVR